MRKILLNSQRQYRFKYIGISLLFFAISFKLGSTSELFVENFHHLRIFSTWMEIKPDSLLKADNLQDGLPDGWLMSWSDGATFLSRIEVGDAHEGEQALRITKTNNKGLASIYQDILLQSGSRLIFSVYAKGRGGNIQIWFHSMRLDDWISEDNGGTLDLPPNEDWTKHRFELPIPVYVDKVRLHLSTSSDSFFDTAYLAERSGEDIGPNLVQNSSFEHDGVSRSALNWWENDVLPNFENSIKADIKQRLSFLNIQDMLVGDYDVIRDRSEHLEKPCAMEPSMTYWLLSRADDFEMGFGLFGREKIYQLAVELAPNCPQPYALLAKLYEGSFAFSRAAELYHNAAKLSSNTPLAGQYFFNEGLLRFRYTGEFEQAIAALKMAEQITGWEGSGWNLGAASFHLGRAYEALGRWEEAVGAYQRVLRCSECIYHRQMALVRIENVSKKIK